MTDRRTAFHEAAHAVACWALGLGVRGVSNVHGNNHAGIMVYDDEVPEPELIDATTPLPVLDPELRRWAECRAVVALAGREGELLHIALPDPDDPPAPRPVPGPETVRPTTPAGRDLRALIQRADTPDTRSDTEVAAEAVWFCAPDPEVQAHHLALCRVLARDLVRLHAERVVRVADALTQARQIEGPALVSLIEGTPHAHQTAS